MSGLPLSTSIRRKNCHLTLTVTQKKTSILTSTCSGKPMNLYSIFYTLSSTLESKENYKNALSINDNIFKHITAEQLKSKYNNIYKSKRKDTTQRLNIIFFNLILA